MTVQCLPPESKINILALERALDLKNLTNSYKLYWLAAILDEVEQQNVRISFKAIIAKMVAKCWYSILKYRLSFGRQDMLHRIVYYLSERYNLTPETSEADIISFLDTINDNNYNDTVKELTRYVPYRFLSPFYKDALRGKADAQKNKIIQLLNCDDDECIYMIDSSNSYITITPKWFDYLYDNLVIVRGWHKFKLIYYLQTRNPNVPAVIEKIEPPLKRTLLRANNFWRGIITLTEVKDIYTGIAVNENDMSIDHFIPWSFVLHDRMWNLCPTSRRTNSQKGDCLPSLPDYLVTFTELQFKAFTLIDSINSNRYIIEDYIQLGIKIDSTGSASKTLFKEVMVNTIEPLHRIALNQGFELWR